MKSVLVRLYVAAQMASLTFHRAIFGVGFGFYLELLPRHQVEQTLQAYISGIENHCHRPVLKPARIVDMANLRLLQVLITTNLKGPLIEFI